MPKTISVILSEPRPADTERQQFVAALTDALTSQKYVDLTVVPHLYDLEPSGPTMEFLRGIRNPMIVICWLHPRAAFWTLRVSDVEGRFANDEAGPDDTRRPIWCLGIVAGATEKTILDEVDRIIAGEPPLPAAAQRDAVAPKRREEKPRERWYPVIDRDRCSGCLECLNFCLFGVYGTDADDDILIEQPDACRPGCPACSRICPEGAIMFPQHDDPAISGDAKASLTGLKLDLSQLFSGADATTLAATEREHALSQMNAAKKTDQLDNLVDELDDLDI